MISKSTDINKLIQTIRSTKSSDLSILLVNQLEKDSVKKMLKQLESTIGKDDGCFIWIKL